MNPEGWLQFLAAAASRRAVLAGVSGGLLTALPLTGETEAKPKGKHRQQKKRRKKASARPLSPPSPPPSPSPPPPPPLETRADAACAQPSQALLSPSEKDARLAQTFAAQASGLLARAELLIDKSQGSTGDYVLSLGTVDVAGVPTNQVLASTSVADGAVAAGLTTVSFTFEQPGSVVAGVEYALILTRPGGSDLAWAGSLDNACAGRSFIGRGPSAAFEIPSVELDLIFTTFVSS